MSGEERDRQEHLEALKRFGGKMPFSRNYTPNCCRYRGGKFSEGNMRADSLQWLGWIEEAFGKAQKQKKPKEH